MIKYGKPIKVDKDGFDTLVEYFRNDKKIVAIYLFGSYARGEQDALSDIDLAFLFRRNFLCTFDEQLNYLEKINSILKTDEISFVILNEAPLLFKYKIISAGKVLYCANQQERLDFEQYVEDLYFDFKPVLAIYDNELLLQVKDGKAFNR
ncbi:MAG: hypothetical protein A2Y62_20390 [Candidatus Fischerbacteria bacterium RBG_13_37_8]|uniref:Polymerase beta nucleotidyltransferase domain-containing protein n=1 Tax=Candidatus Fischerbacteria bacterium RBG_13_37_8 TaxID=1817863 RepID=A0A1F5VX28_9BACT|nr:MAG: hypothetical protein A2Y62_20390 [Candidatus Fischerbacteria bacterium RBG_13_37_8]